jgi:hypothetical protein
MEGATLYGMMVDCSVTGGILLGIMGRYHEREFVRWCEARRARNRSL